MDPAGAAVSWSHDLCTPAEQRLWAEFSVFPGGFGLEAAERICGPGTFDALIRLVEKSVVQYSDDTRRYHLLDTMREYGAEQLTAAGEDTADAKPLTRREKEIAVLVADGLGNREIAERLFLSRRTVESHIEHIFAKLGLSSRTQLTGWVLGQKESPSIR